MLASIYFYLAHIFRKKEKEKQEMVRKSRNYVKITHTQFLSVFPSMTKYSTSLEELYTWFYSNKCRIYLSYFYQL